MFTYFSNSTSAHIAKRRSNSISRNIHKLHTRHSLLQQLHKHRHNLHKAKKAKSPFIPMSFPILSLLRPFKSDLSAASPVFPAVIPQCMWPLRHDHHRSNVIIASLLSIFALIGFLFFLSYFIYLSSICDSIVIAAELLNKRDNQDNKPK